MKEPDDEKLRTLLRSALAPVADSELKRDLWPQLLRRFDEQAFRVAWFEWGLIALLAILFFFFPEVIPVLAFHL